MGSLLNWIQSRNAEAVLARSNIFIQKVLEVVVEFERGFVLLVNEKKPALATTAFQRVGNLEHEADVMRRDILNNLSKYDVPAQVYEDFSQFIKTVDAIANCTNAASRRILGIDASHILALGQDPLNKMIQIINSSVEATKIFFNLMKKLTQLDEKEVQRIADQIQKLEHQCDVLHTEIYICLNKIPLQSIQFNVFVGLQISELVDLLESITDKVEDVTDYVELIKVAKK